MKRNKNVKHFAELFAGIGLVRMGLEPHGWQCVFSNDIDKKKEELYRQYFPDSEDFIREDIWKLNADQIPPCELVTVSFPCIDLSVAGARRGIDGQHSGTFWAFIRLLEGMIALGRKPTGLLIENVVGFVTSHGGADLRRALETLKGLGYCFDVLILDARHFKPQSRPRLFILAVALESKPPSMKILGIDAVLSEGCQMLDAETELRTAKLKTFIHSNLDLPWALLSLPTVPKDKQRFSDYAERLPKNDSVWWDDERCSKLLGQMKDEHLHRIQAHQASKQLQYFTVYKRIRNAATRAEARFDGIAGCLRTAGGGSSKQIVVQAGRGEIKVRWMTGREYARLQGVPDSYPVPSNLVQAVNAYGDAVCVPAISWIAKNLLGQVFPART